MSENDTTPAQERPLPQTVVEALQRTKEVLQEQGRTTEKNFRDGKVCLNGASLVAIGLYDTAGKYLGGNYSLSSAEFRRRQTLQLATSLALDDVTQERTGRAYFATGYNDLPGTTDEDIASLIDAAIAKAESGPVDQ
jgi:hypothetical protein